MKRLALLTAVVLATLLVLLVIWELRVAIVLFFFSLGLAAAVRPMVEGLARSGLPKFLGLAGTYVTLIAAIGALMFLVVSLLLGEAQRATDDFVQVHEEIAASWPEGTWFQRAVARRVPDPEHLYAALSGQQRSALVETILGTAFGVITTVVNLVVILVLSIYWSLDRIHFERLWLSLLPSDQRVAYRDTWRAVEGEVGAYFRSEVVQAILGGLLLGIGFWALGVRYPTLMAVVAALAWMIPWAGSLIALACLMLAAIPSAILQGFAPAASTTVAAMLYSIAVFIVLEYLVEPRLFNRGRYNSLLIAAAIVALADTFGILGLFLGPPLAVMAEVIGERLLRQRLFPASVTPLPKTLTLEDRAEELRTRLAAMQSIPPEIASLVDRLEDLADEARQILPDLPQVVPQETNPAPVRLPR